MIRFAIIYLFKCCSFFAHLLNVRKKTIERIATEGKIKDLSISKYDLIRI